MGWFDTILHKAINIAEKNKNIINEEGWFIIMEFLLQYRQKVLEEPTVSSSKKAPDRLKLDLLRDFIK